ncbi:hypothetical protein FGG08_001469 [Glutinoglossum americanum]|uniref:Uncharacterized protein n=1 Tax=Glutinoglossum americanum TaxID=1670608 RepID=A0A9P8I8A9_9PEZI|nr:hypothetical protein FGG08_001469 [Glutinoglossum americanum]
MPPLIARLVPEIIQEVDSYLSFPDQVFLRQANKTYLCNKLYSARRTYYVQQEQIEYLMRKAFYARNCQRRSGGYSQEEIFCYGCMALHPKWSFDDLSRTFAGPLPATTEEIMQSGANRLCISCSLNLGPFEFTPYAYHCGRIISVDGRPLSRCICCRQLQGNLLRVRLGGHDYATFAEGCPTCGVCASCFSLASHDCSLYDGQYRQSMGVLVYLNDYYPSIIQEFTTNVSVMMSPEYQESTRRMRLTWHKMDKTLREALLNRYLRRTRRGATGSEMRRSSRR